MSIVCIARRHGEKDVNFKVSYLKNSVWVKDNGDARVMIHCVIRAAEDSAAFNSLRIVVSENVFELTNKNMSSLLLDKRHMEEYEDSGVKFEILSEEDSHIRGNGGEYFVTDVMFGDVNPIGDFSEFLVTLQSSITTEKARGFRIEFVSRGYVKKLKNRELYYMGVYDTHMVPTLLGLSDNYTDEDVMEVEYGDLWITSPKNKISDRTRTSITPAETQPFKFLPPSSDSGYREWEIEKDDLKERIAYRWRVGKCNTTSGFSVHGEFSSPPLSNLYTYTAIVLAVLGIIEGIFIYVIF